MNLYVSRIALRAPHLISLAEATRAFRRAGPKASLEAIRAAVSLKRRWRCRAETVNLSEAAYLLACSRALVRSYRRRGLLPGRIKRFGSRFGSGYYAWEIRLEDVERLVEQIAETKRGGRRRKAREIGRAGALAIAEKLAE